MFYVTYVVRKKNATRKNEWHSSKCIFYLRYSQ